MKHRLLVGAVALLLFSLSLLLSLPAERALGYFDDLLAANELHLQGISGTLHSGGAGQLGWRGRDLGALRWQLAPGCLLLGRICLNLQLQNSAGYLQGEIELFSDGAVMFSGLEGQLPAGAAVSLLLTLPVEIEGLLSLHLEQLVLDASSTPVAAQGVVSWHQAALGAPQRLDFGDLQLRLNTTAEGIVGELRDGGGPLQIEGQLLIAEDRNYQISAGLSARSGADPALANYLGMLGGKDSSGLHRFSHSGVF